MYIYIKHTFITYGSSYLGLSCLVQIGGFSCLCAEQHQTPPKDFGTNDNLKLSEGEQCGCVLKRAASGR